MEVSKRTVTRIGHLSSSTKNNKKQKRYHLMTESLFSNNTSNRFKFIMIPTFVAETEQLLYLHESQGL